MRKDYTDSPEGKEKTEGDSSLQSPPTFFQLLQSVLGALIGVQSEAARHRDFSRGRPLHFIVIGVVATVLLVLGFVGIVRLVLAIAGA